MTDATAKSGRPAARMTGLLDLIDWTRLPESTRPVARMLSRGLTQKEIATELGWPDQQVARQVKLLRDAIVGQALEQCDRLSVELREHLVSLRSQTAKPAGGGCTRRRRTV